MLSKAQNKYIRSLTQHKFRREFKAFIAEGDKIAREWLQSDKTIQHIVALNDWAVQNESLIALHPEAELHIVKESELSALSTLQTPNQALLVVHMPDSPLVLPVDEWCIVLDDIQDPGNMGTIIRIADWFGIAHVVCSMESVDVYNPKVIQAAMGGHLRVSIHKTDVKEFVASTNMPVLAATLDGKSIYQMDRLEAAVLVIGNESRGISEDIMSLATDKITIPRKGGAESLNAAISTGIICSHLLPE
ncbi:MAG: TrmH family RNA methyltransferase [Flavipsychrobacter sp.]